MGYAGMMIIWSLLILASIIGFAYIILVMSAKESGMSKTVGMIIGWIIIVLAVVLYIYGLTVGRSMHGKMMMMKGGMMMERSEGNMMMEKGEYKMMPGKHMRGKY